jgi:hypothetical protein
MQAIIVQFLIWILPLVLKRFAESERRGLIVRIIDRLRGEVPEADGELMGAAADGADLPGLLEMVRNVFAAIPPEAVQFLGDALFDIVEDAIEASATRIDDMFLLPAIGLARKALEIPDDEAEQPEQPAGPEINI